MNCRETRVAIVEALAGAGDPRREAAVDEHLRSCAACGEEGSTLSQTWAALSVIGDAEVPSDRMRVRFRAALGAYEAGIERSWARRLGRWVGDWARRAGGALAALEPSALAATAAALLALGVGIGWGAAQTLGGHREADRLRTEIASMNRAVAVALLEHHSASERLRGVSWGAASGPDERVLAALVEAVQHDDSVGVRLAAVEALAAHIERPAVRAGLLAALEKRPQPQLQMAVSRLIAGDEGSRGELERLLASDLLDPEVRRLLTEDSGRI